ncbi:Lysophospholipase, alpha-beta hydrolase superfamily [Rhizobium sp. EC-SD404]|nr:Lysophospholipase, alpha-beta hydrolase superfamily [Rhizobium sp. EC-SD404]
MAAMTMSFEQSYSIDSPTGATLSLRRQPADGTARGILVLSHGLAEHSARYGAFARSMAATGLEVYAHDHRGHGQTVASDAPIGRFGANDGRRKVVADVMAVRAHALTNHQGLPVILFGHSMGGLIAWNSVISNPAAFDAVAVWNSNFQAGAAGRAAQAILAIEKAMKGSDVPSGMLPRLTFEAWGKAVPNRRTLFDWLSHDQTVVDAYIADPLCGFDASVSLWQDLFGLIYRGGNAANWSGIDRHLPIHLVGGAEDPATNGGKAVDRMADDLRRAGFRDVTLALLSGFRHETLNEIGAAQPIEAFQSWVDRVLEHRRPQEQ